MKTQTKEAKTDFPNLVSVTEASQILGWGWWKTRGAIDRGELRSLKMPNGHRVVLKESVLAMKATLEVVEVYAAKNGRNGR